MIPLVLSGLALLGAILAVTIAVAVARQSGAVASTLERHRNAHVLRDGTADPDPERHRADRRKVNLGPPRATGERRAAPGHPLPPEETLHGHRPLPEEPPTAAMKRLPRPGEIGQR